MRTKTDHISLSLSFVIFYIWISDSFYLNIFKLTVNFELYVTRLFVTM